MLYIIAFTSGVKDTNIYILLASMNVSMIAMGQLVEENIRDGKNWQLPMFIGFLLLVFEFSVICKDFWIRLGKINDFINQNPSYAGTQNIPDWINYMIIVLFIL